ncbi:MAG: hypothetical protein KatS3mg044_0362 [Rhodothermaceae bacterium]|nr:MAG: hypothetical protein KatS3mg044_0362 [Rhodothermaceae bacterium]
MEQVRPLHRRKAGIRLLCWLGLFLGVGWLHAALHPLLAQQGRGTPLGEVTDHPLRFRHLTIADGLSQNAVYAIVQDHRGFMWFGTKDGLNRYDGDTFVVFRHDPSSSTSLPDNHVTALFEDAGGRLWVGTQTGALARFDRRTETFVACPLGTSARVTGIDDSPGGALWVATDGGGLYRLAAEASPETAPSAVFRHDPGNPQGLSHDRVYAVLVDRTGAVWAGTEAGLDRIDPGTQAVHHYPADASQPGGVVGGRITALLEDDAGQLWAAGVAGLNRLDAGRTQIARYYHRYRTFRYGWGEALQLLQDRDGLLWIATHSELMRFDPAAERFSYHRHDPARPCGINSNQPTALYQDRAGVIWIGTNGYGLNLYDPKEERFRTFRRPAGPPSRVAGFSVYTLFEDSGGDVWISNGILHRWDRASGTLFSYETTSDRPDDFGNTGVWSMVEAPTGTLWVGSSQGLYRYRRATGHYRQYRHDPARPDGLPEQGSSASFGTGAGGSGR